MERTPIQASFEQLPGMSCFACAPKRLNAHGLDLVFAQTEDGAEVRFRLPAHFESYPGFLHGGIVAAVLDETMAYAGVFKLNVLPFTRSLQLQFRQGVKGETSYLCKAWLVASTEDRFSAKGAIRDERGLGIVTGTAEFVVPTLEMAKKMLGDGEIERFRSFFR
jgi:acyl-coenzyme A thioesterase PaaI-like protein